MTSKLVDSSSRCPKSIVPSAIRLTSRPDRPRWEYVMPLMFRSVITSRRQQAVTTTVNSSVEPVTAGDDSSHDTDLGIPSSAAPYGSIACLRRVNPRRWAHACGGSALDRLASKRFRVTCNEGAVSLLEVVASVVQDSRPWQHASPSRRVRAEASVIGARGAGSDQELVPGEIAVERRRVDEVGVRALTDDLAVVHDDDVIAVDDGRQAVGDHDERAIGRDGVDRVAHALLVEAVQ